jgi:hypothetical protein
MSATVVGIVVTTPVTWKVTQGAGSIDSSGRFTSNTAGVATVTATISNTPVGTLTASTAILVGAGPPGAVRNITATAGVFSATVSWEPPATDGGSPITGYVVTTIPASTTVRVGPMRETTILPGLASGLDYILVICAQNKEGCGVAGFAPTAVHPFDSSVAVQPWATPMAEAARVDDASYDGRYVLVANRPSDPLAPVDIRDQPEGLYAVRLDVLNGERTLAGRDLDGHTPVALMGPARMDDSGRFVVYAMHDTSGEHILVNDLRLGSIFDAAEKASVLVGYPVRSASLRDISADGSRMVYTVAGDGTSESVVRVEIASRARSVLPCFDISDTSYACAGFDNSPDFMSGDGRFFLSGNEPNQIIDADLGTWVRIPIANTGVSPVEVWGISDDATRMSGSMSLDGGGSWHLFVGRDIRSLPTNEDMLGSVDSAISRIYASDAHLNVLIVQTGNDNKFYVFKGGTVVLSLPSEAYPAVTSDGQVVFWEGRVCDFQGPSCTSENSPVVWAQRLE